MEKCPNCGSPIKEGAKFCPKCGNQILKVESAGGRASNQADAAQGNADQRDADQGNADRWDADQGNADQRDAAQGNADQADADQGNADRWDADQQREKPAPKKKRSWILFLAVIAVIGILIGGIGVPMTVRAYQEKRIAAHLELGDKYLMEENYEQALAEYQTVASIAPKRVDAYLGMGQAYVGMENYDSAKNCMDQVFEYYDSGQNGDSADKVVGLVLDLAEYEQAEGSLREVSDFLERASDIVDSQKITKMSHEIEKLIEVEEALKAATEEKYKELLADSPEDMYEAEKDAVEKYKQDIQDLMDKGKYTDAMTEMEKWQKIMDAINQNTDYQMSVEQVDVSEFPLVKVYVRVEDKNTGESVDDLQEQSFYVSEQVEGQNGFERMDIIRAVQLNETENLNICMVGDVSDSMSGSRISDAKLVMANFLGSMQTQIGDRASLITFSDQVYTNMGFTSDIGQLNAAIQQLATQSMTAFYDALYVAINQTAIQSGAKCVIAFTDGMDNQSQCTPEIVTELAARYNIPIFIIGIDPSVSLDIMTSIAEGTGGFYRNINDITNMSEIYEAIYRQQKEMYLLEYQTQQEEVKEAARAIEVNYMDEDTVVRNEYEYVPSVYMEATVSAAQMFVNDFIVYDSDQRYLTAADLALLNQEQLRLARNEIYARQGRMFKDQELQNYFSSKSWYTPSIAPEAFRETMFNDYERANAYFIADYERLKGYLQ